MRFVKPLDEILLDDISSRFDKIVTIEDNVRIGGFGSAVLEYLASKNITNVDVLVHGIPDRFIEHGTQTELFAMLKLDPQGIADLVRQFIEASAPHLRPAHSLAK